MKRPTVADAMTGTRGPCRLRDTLTFVLDF